jgi:hypothetical protein
MLLSCGSRCIKYIFAFTNQNVNGGITGCQEPLHECGGFVEIRWLLLVFFASLPDWPCRVSQTFSSPGVGSA